MGATGLHAQPTGTWIPVVVDTTVAAKAMARITELEAGPEGQASRLLYLNTVEGAYYQNDREVVSGKEMRARPLPFKSFYYWLGDTLAIDGGVGMFEGSGFSVLVHDGKALVRHLIAEDEPFVGYTPTDSLQYRLEVPCTDTRLVLAQVPDPTYRAPLFGYVEFQSVAYYAHQGSVDGQAMPRVPMRADMRLFFRSVALPVK